MAWRVSGQGFGGGGVEHGLDDALLAGGDAGLAVDEGAVVHAGGEGDVGVGGGEDAAAGGEDLGGHLDGLGEVSGDVGEGGDEEVAEAVAFELALAEAELEELERRCSSSERATMQLRTSPGGSILKSSRRRPEEPPSSVTVTTAERSLMMQGSVGAGVGGGAAGDGGVDADAAAAVGGGYVAFEAAEKGERPVPPPMATTRRVFSVLSGDSAEVCMYGF